MKPKFFPHCLLRLQYALLLALTLLCIWPATAWSHAHPKQRVPAAGATLQQAPSAVRIRFSEELEPAFSSLDVTDSQGDSVNQGHSRVEKGKPRLLVAPLKSLEHGTYTVHWHVVARDGHTTQGHYTFQVVPATNQ